MNDTQIDVQQQLDALTTAVTTGHFLDHKTNGYVEAVEQLYPFSNCIDQRCPATRFAAKSDTQSLHREHINRIAKLERLGVTECDLLRDRIKKLEQPKKHWWKP
jgi:hypothetical protein